MVSSPQFEEKRAFPKTSKVVLYIITAVGFALIILLNIVFIKPTLNELLDFGSFIAAGNAIRDGVNPYSSDLPLVFNPGSEQVLPSPNLNPPISVILFRPLAGLDPLQAVLAWRIAAIIQFGLAVYILGKTYPNHITPLRILWTSSLAGLWTTLALGQIYASILVLSVCAWIFAEKGKPILAGVALGIVIAIKPNFGFWVLLLGVARQYTIFLSAASTALTLSFLPIPIFGIQIYKQWLTALSEYPSIGLLIAGNSSLYSLSARFGLPGLGAVATVVLMGISIYLAYRNRDSIREINTIGIIGSLLASPFAWTGYTILCLPIYLSRPRWKWPAIVTASIMVFPYILVMYFFNRTFFNSILIGWLYGWGLLILFVEVIVTLTKKPQTKVNQ
jgi:hypothetical protein